MIRAAVETVLECYPAIFFACHRKHVRDEKSHCALSAHQASVLDHLDAVQPTHLHELAGHMGITPSSMSLMVDRLEKGGFIRRARDPHDARRVNLRLTAAGLRIQEQQKVLDPQLVEAMLRRLPSDQRNAALAGLRTLAQAAQEMIASGECKRLRQEARA
jgi:DNA-binding MarR family transcriptional regulator